MQASRPLRVTLILFSTRSDNLGVGALTVAQVEILRNISREIGRQIEITIVDPKDKRPSYVTGPDIQTVDLDRRFMVSPSGYISVARKSDLVIDGGGGDSFSDIYGSDRLKRILFLKAATHLVGTPIVIAPQTIGPFAARWSKTLALASIRRSAIVATRDELSTAALRELGYSGTVVEASDMALELPYLAAASTSAQPIRVGINVSGLLMKGGYTRNNQFGLTLDYPRLIRDIVRYFIQHPDGCEVHLVPHVVSDDPHRSHVEDDWAPNVELAAEFPEVLQAPRFFSPSDAKSYISGMHFFLGARMHACIAAFSSGVPVIPMAYSRKFHGLFGTLDYNLTVDCTRQGNEEVFQTIVTSFENRNAIRESMATCITKGEARLREYQKTLRELIEKIST